jgi:branched-chain amino acid transport system substrate-binding protein
VRRTFTSLLVAICALGLPGCLGRTEPESTHVSGDVLTIYSSLPSYGPTAPIGAAVAAGERLALARAGGEAAGRRVRLVQLDSADQDSPLWSPEAISANADRAAEDPTTIAYLGELGFGATAVSLPITNEAGLLQVSPADGLTSLTRTPPGRPRAGPERYYPSEVRSFLRLIPDDLLEAETLLERVNATGAQRLAVVFDADIYGRELGAELIARARRDGPTPVVSEEYTGDVETVPDLTRKLAEARPDAIVYAGVAGAGTGPLLAGIDRALPGVPLYATSGMLVRDPARPIPAAPEHVEALGAVPPASRIPREGRRILREVARRDGPRAARPEALYGYEAMKVVLDAIGRAGPDRPGVIKAALAIRTRDSAIGRYGIRATGDVDGDAFAVYDLRDGRFAFHGMAR